METLRDLFEDTLKDVYWAEKAITKALPKMVQKATAPKLKAAFESHLKETEGQIKRIEKVFEILGEKPSTKKCDATEGLLKEADGIMEEAKTSEIMDVGLISSAQAVEHYEIARYGTMRTWAEELQMPAAAKLLQETLDEEHACNDALTKLAEGAINVASQHPKSAGGKPAARDNKASAPASKSMSQRQDSKAP